MSGTGSQTGIKKLRDFGYGFNKVGELRKFDKITNKLTDEPFQHKKHSNRNNGQFQHLLNKVLYELLEAHGLKRTYIPENLPQKRASFFFAQPERLRSTKKLLVLISGYAGKWSNDLILEKSLKHGSQLQYIKRAQALDYDLLVMNNYDNYRLICGKLEPIHDLRTAGNHAAYIWEHYVLPAQPESVAIVAYSNAGQAAFDLAARYPEFFKAKVFAIALLNTPYFNESEEVFQIVGHCTCNWIESEEKALNTVITVPGRDSYIRHVSAGKNSKKDGIPYAVSKSVFRFLEEKYGDFQGKTKVKA